MAAALSRKNTKSGASWKQRALREKTSTKDNALWVAEIDALQSRTFASFEEAVDAVVARVAVSMPGNGDHSECRAFLKQLIELDPELQEWLRSGLKISTM